MIISAVVIEPDQPTQSCFPSPCGPYSVCELEGPRVVCSCQKGYFGKPPNCHPECLVNGECPPNKACIREKCLDPCQGTCGVNAVCQNRNNAAACTCLPELFGDPYIECKPECSTNPECPDNKACLRNKCADPCPGVCGSFASCRTQRHQPTCTCDPGYTGDPFRFCSRITTCKFALFN